MKYEILKYERIRDLRVDAGLSQKEIAQYLHIGQNTYSQYELDRRGIPNETLSRIADFHNTSTDYLLGRTDIKEPYPKSTRQEL